jgi:hypothetical protein
MSAGPAGAQSAAAGPPRPGGYFELLPAGAALPSEKACARRVRRSAWEPRPGNFRANHTTPGRRALPRQPDHDARWNARHRPRITGRFVGTTDELIQWAACKWGLSDELLRAQAAAESGWSQRTEGDLEPRSDGHCAPGDRRDPCPTSFGLLQTKWYFHPGGYPMVRTMTSFHLDWSAAQLRGCYEGSKGVVRGDFDACLGNWFSGGWDDPGGRAYVERVMASLAAKPWRGWRDRGASVPHRPSLRARSVAASPPARARR